MTTMNTGAASLSDEQWYDLAQRHANADWNSNGYLDAIKAVCADYVALATPTPQADAAPSDPLRSAVESMVCMLENGEWAEHVAEAIANGDELASRLETAITELHNDIGEPRAAIAAGGAQEAIYQVYFSHGWLDVDEKDYGGLSGDKRIVYAAPLPREAAAAWQPIETAPKTGRTLLLGYPNVLGKWRTVRGQWMSEAYIAEQWEEPDDAEPGWYETSVEADSPPNCWPIEPTHWMPLPAAPAAASNGEQ